jgi:hypothetical protein
MSKRDGKMYVVRRLFREAETTLGLTVRMEDDETAGCMWVFWTKAAARKTYGRNVKLMEIRLEEGPKS